MNVTDYRRGRHWRYAMKLAASVYRLTDGFPDSEKSGLSATLRRAAAGIPVALAKGWGPGPKPEALNDAAAKTDEVVAYLQVSRGLRLAAPIRFAKPLRAARRLLWAINLSRPDDDEQSPGPRLAA